MDISTATRGSYAFCITTVTFLRAGRIDPRRWSGVPRYHCARGIIAPPARLAGIGTVPEQEASDGTIESSRNGQYVVECLFRLGSNQRKRFVSDPR